VTPKERTPAVFTREKKLSLLEKFNRGYALFGSDIHVVGSDGALWYVSYHPLPKEDAPSGFVQVSRTHPQGDIYAPRSRTTEFRELRVNQIKGGVEEAIHAMDHIWETQLTRETPQMKTLTGRAHELLEMFSGEFNTITPDQFIQARKKTEHILRDVHLNPARIINQEKQRITAWLLKASAGHDSLERRNKLITCMALSAAFQHGIEQYSRIGIIQGKYVRMREALIFEREFSRSMLTQVADLLAPTRLPASKLFRDIERPAERNQVSNILGLLLTMAFQLQQPHAAPYMPAGREAAEIIVEITNLVCDNKRGEILTNQLFFKAHAIITKVLADHQHVYPESNG